MHNKNTERKNNANFSGGSEIKKTLEYQDLILISNNTFCC